MATIYGSLGNFDVVNNTGRTPAGFEVELEGVAPTAIPSTFSVALMACPPLPRTPRARYRQLRVRWCRDCSPTKTIARPPGTGFAGTCYQMEHGHLATILAASTSACTTTAPPKGDVTLAGSHVPTRQAT